MKQIYSIDEINILDIKIDKPSIVFLTWDLWAGKTTLSKHIINTILDVDESVTSPTYTYYNKYESKKYWAVYHFDLYRLGNYDEFFAIWGEEIFDNNTGIILVEWPQLIAKYYTPDIDIHLHKTNREDTRILEIK